MRYRMLMGVILLGIVVSGFLMLNKMKEKEEEDESMHIISAIPIYSFNVDIKTEEDALKFFNQFFDEILNKTQNESSILQLEHGVESLENFIFFKDYAVAERRGWENDKYWLGPDASAYVIVVPAVSKFENSTEKDGQILVERCTLKNLKLGQNISIPVNISSYEDVKKYLNETYPGEVEIYWEKSELWMKYLIGEDRQIYWAGCYLRTKPWLGY